MIERQDQIPRDQTKSPFLLGIYGGTFAPIHNGHIYAVQKLLEHFALDRLLLIPNRKPPHKRIAASDDPSHRLAMLRLAFPQADTPQSRISISDFEILSEKPSYTSLTLQHFSNPNTRIIFFCGTDMFLSMDTWHEPQVIFSLAEIAHLPRLHLSNEDESAIAKATKRYEQTYGAVIHHPKITPYPLSSTEVRLALKQGKGISDLVPPAVADYIAAHGLYREASE